MSRNKLFLALFEAVVIAFAWAAFLVVIYIVAALLSIPVSLRTQIIEGVFLLVIVPGAFFWLWVKVLNPQRIQLQAGAGRSWVREDVRKIIRALIQSDAPMTVAQLASTTGYEPSLVVMALNIVHQDGNLLSTRGYWNSRSALTDGQGYSVKPEAAAQYHIMSALGGRIGS